MDRERPRATRKKRLFVENRSQLRFRIKPTFVSNKACDLSAREGTEAKQDSNMASPEEWQEPGPAFIDTIDFSFASSPAVQAAGGS